MGTAVRTTYRTCVAGCLPALHPRKLCPNCRTRRNIQGEANQPSIRDGELTPFLAAARAALRLDDATQRARVEDWHRGVLAALSGTLARHLERGAQQGHRERAEARALVHVLGFLRIVPPDRVACLAGAFALMRAEQGAWRFASERGYRFQFMRAVQRLAQQTADDAVRPRFPAYLPTGSVAVLEAASVTLMTCFGGVMSTVVRRRVAWSAEGEGEPPTLQHSEAGSPRASHRRTSRCR